MATTDIEYKKNKLNWVGFILAAIGVMIFTGAYFCIVSNSISDWENRGLFGDMFGGLTSLFTGLAFAGLIYTILIQRKELQYQREEITLQRIEMTRFANAQEKSERALSKQSEYLELSARISALGNLMSQRETIEAYVHNNDLLRSQFYNLLKDGSRIFIKMGTQLTQADNDA